MSATPWAVEIDDASDPRLSDYADLTDVALRRRREPAEGLFMAEGEKVIRRALAAGYPVRSMLLTPRWAEAMREVCVAAGAPVYVVEPAVAEAVTGYHVHRGALAAMSRTPLPPVAELLAGPTGPGADAGRGGHGGDGGRHDGRARRRVAVLEDIVDHANVGAAFRNAAALGIDAVLLSPRCADPLYRRSVKVSMGAVFQIPWARLDSWPGELEILAHHGYTTAALCLADDSVPLAELAAREEPRLALMFGTEGDGLSAGALRGADVRVTIPMAAGVDSLNVAAASAVAFYATQP
ncbi:TrmH family RNA methyltransferase [Streptomyces otsuchiensis]|uniref:TrmH family RNA methyltransferase n=1 Tax=Streptomyces otsuchiensis TaxID=2681388 RepID=UPI00103152B1|nr:RNA methyltransferase [Streptomyces otsuchiensis]